MTVGAQFTAAQLGELLPGYVDDKACRLGAVIRELNRRGYIEFYAYGPRAVPGNWDSPARVWRRTEKTKGSGEAA
ncbi:hypothetical protein ACFVKB_05100 [Rhodococcus sp. NPDC127530]|uniref:hypothetical protein n=1 Tax=unclassified Rhodococcus (in: high G+C Gram-positive bacteria) TaxID=192944 RepID=UPI0036341FDC